MKDEEYLRWLGDLKVGDTVAVEHGYSTYSIGKVETVSRHRIKACNREFKRASFAAGYNVKSGTFDATHRLLPVTDKIRENVRYEQMLRKVRHMEDKDWKGLPPEVLQQIYNLLTEVEKGKPE